MINNSKAKTGLFEGTFQYDALASNSIEFAKAEVELEELNKVAFADTSYGEYLTMLAKQYGVIRKEATKAIGVLTVKGTGTIYTGATFATESGIQFTATENTVAITAIPYMPAPQAIPILAAIHNVAAVVKPNTIGPFLNTVPAPIKPIPVTICAATRDVSLIPVAFPIIILSP